ncbi:MAG: tetratricopeptide repeat protein [Candidatus Marinimicrobia bacterium]|nr:tetratricopeptide repeat protein [Candidatus Neomarinimicrobiota bacterium]
MEVANEEWKRNSWNGIQQAMNKRVLISIVIILTILIAVIATGYRTQPSVTTTSPEAYEFYLKGLDRNQNFYHAEAIGFLEKAIELDSEFAMAYLQLFFSYEISGEYVKSRQMIEKATLLKEYVSEREALIIEINKNMGEQHNQALADSLIEVLYQKYPKSLEAHLYKARLAVRENDTEDAIKFYNNVVDIDEDYAPVYNILGYMYAELNRYDEAIENLKKYAKKAPGEVNPYDSIGEILIRVGRYDEALESLKKGLEIKPELTVTESFLGAAIHKNIGNAYFGRGQISEAVKNFDLATSLYPGEYVLLDAVLNKYLALVLSRRWNDFNSNSEGLDELDANERTKPFKHLIKGIYHLAHKDIQSAIDESEGMKNIIISLSEENSYVYDRLDPINGMLDADIKISQGRYSEAVEIFTERCLKSDLTKHSSWFNWRLAEAYRLNEQYEKSKGIVESVLSINPNDYILRSLLVQVYFNEGDYKSAKSELKRVKSLLSQSDSDLIFNASMRKIEEALEVLL